MRRSEDAYTIKGRQASKILKEMKEPATDKQKKTLIQALQNRVSRKGYDQ